MSDGGQAWRLKDGGGFFAAGTRFRSALQALKPAPFQLFAWICLHAERATGRLEFRRSDLARGLGWSLSSIQRHLRALELAGVCDLERTPNHRRPSAVTVRPDFWPYEAPPESIQPESTHVVALRAAFETSPCTTGPGGFGATDERLAQRWMRDGVKLEDALLAILLLSARKTCQSLDASGCVRDELRVRTLAYFEADVNRRAHRDERRRITRLAHRDELACWRWHVNALRARLRFEAPELADELFPKLVTSTGAES